MRSNLNMVTPSVFFCTAAFVAGLTGTAGATTEGPVLPIGETTSATPWTSIGGWSSSKVTVRASNVGFPSGSSWRSSVATVVSRIYNNPSKCYINQLYGDTSVGQGNGQNELWWSSSASFSPAVTLTRRHWFWGTLTERDVVFFTGGGYTTSMARSSLSAAYGGGSRPFETTLMHEYGHVLGLGHEDDEYNIMGTDFTHMHANGSTARSYLGEDACDGLISLYGLNGNLFEDVAVTLFKYAGLASGEYSVHTKCRMFRTSGSELSFSYDPTVSGNSTNRQRRYHVSKGQQVDVEFTYENNGASQQKSNVMFYISTNSYISTGDRKITSSTTPYWVNQGRANVYTRKLRVTIPSNLTSGSTYYLGAIIDYDNKLSEVDGGNNAAYHIIKVN